MKRILPYSLIAVVLIAVLGMRAGWFHQGFSEAQLEQLERDWAEVVGWAALPEIDAAADRPLTELALEWHAAMLTEAASEREAGAKRGSLSRADLSPAMATILERFEVLLREERSDVPIDPDAALAVLQLAQLALSADDLDAGRMAHVLELARRLQRDGHLMMFMVGTAMGREALDRCREDAALVPAKLRAPAPRPDEFFGALCRDYVVVQREQIVGTLAMEESGPLERFPAAGEFLSRSSHAAMVNIAQRYRPLRDEPERFGEVPTPEPVGKFALWRAATFRRPEAMTRVMEALLQPQIQTRGKLWAEFVEDWNEVLGA